MAFGLFKKKKENKDDRYLNLTVKEVVHIAKDAVNLVFEKPDQFEYQPGQFITIISEVKGKKIRRAYSLCTTPFEDDHPAVTVKRVPDGAMSNFLNEEIKAGDVLQVMEPMGMFTTEYDASKSRNAVFFGGGSGITPLISIVRSLLLKEPDSRATLVYANRSDEYIIFKDLINQLAESHAERFQAVHVLENGEADYSGRLTDEIISKICTDAQCSGQTEFYICGPQPMMDVTFSGLEKAGYPDDQVRMESFEAGKTSPKEIIVKEEGGDSDVTILLDGEEHSVTVKKGAAILDSALKADLDMPYSCQSGLCTACRGKCLEGEISTDEAEGLSQDELDEGYVLTCVGKPLSAHVKVEIG
ncbi:MAG: ferredoxin--NADP reductase [Cyclobacteriaceae bacterium]